MNIDDADIEERHLVAFYYPFDVQGSAKVLSAWPASALQGLFRSSRCMYLYLRIDYKLIACNHVILLFIGMMTVPMFILLLIRLGSFFFCSDVK